LVDEGIVEHIAQFDHGDARSWLANLIATLGKDDQVRVFVTLWAIWHTRRKAIHEQVYQIPLSVHQFMESFIADLKQCEEVVKKKRVATPGQSIGRWIPPPQGMTKVNVDAVVSKNTGRGTVAVIAYLWVPQR
jgi:hypothetical protein